MRTIEQYQIRKIYAIGHALGISGGSDDELHALVAGMTGKDSIKSLTYKEGGEVIARLENMQGGSASPQSARKRPVEYEERPGGVTSGQQKKIWALMYELKKYDKLTNNAALGDRLCKIIKKELKVDAIAKTPFIWLDFGQGNKLIEILKKYVESAERKKRGVTDDAVTR